MSRGQYYVAVCASHCALQDRVRLVGELGGEVSAWLEEKCPTQCATQFPSKSAAECASKCADVTDITLQCDISATPASDTGETMTSVGLFEPCDYKCGPFTNNENAFEAVDDFFTDGRGTLSTQLSVYRVLIQLTSHVHRLDSSCLRRHPRSCSALACVLDASRVRLLQVELIGLSTRP